MTGAAALLGALVLVPSAGSADPSSPGGDDPSISEVQQRLSHLRDEAEVASEKYNDVKVEMQQAQDELTALRSDVSRQRDKVQQLRSQVVGQAVSDYEAGGGLSDTTSFLVAEDPGAFVDKLANQALVDHRQTDMLSDLIQQQRRLSAQQKQAKQAVAAIEQDKKELAEHKQTLGEKVDEAQSLLDHLKAEQRRRLLELQRQRAAAAAERARAAEAAETAQQNAPAQQAAPAPQADRTNSHETTRGGTRPPASEAPAPPPPPPPASSRAATAVQAALAQVGKPYVYGAAGPGAFDCSGLMMYAWGAAGVSLPHSSSGQASIGTPVSISNLQPGDLVFYYSPIHHVGMYIGHGMIVHAANPSVPVRVVPVNMMPITTARRIG